MGELFYKSTRNSSIRVSASQAILKGLSDEGGLFIPERIPTLDIPMEEIAKMTYAETAYEVMNNWGANHGAISYGHIGADLITMCSMMRIPVCMHNVPEEKIFRPAAWNAFGMDKESADYRACATYGPFYK